MKTNRVNGVLSLFLVLSGFTVVGQNSAAIPGDHFSLEGALELFKKSASPQEFEQLLNSQSAKVNNLDLNDDGEIDYIKVIDRNEGTVHAFILQAVVSPTENQDVAVIELEKLANGKAVLQITGDADIYGIETIIEPTEEVRINAGTSTARSAVNVWSWPSVQYVYSPYYSAWYSPWGWNTRPVWWSSWRPVSYYVYSPWWTPYRSYYSPCHTHRIVYAQRIYKPYRTTSIVVYNRHHDQIANYRSSERYAQYNRSRDDDRRAANSQDNWSGSYHRGTSERQQSGQGYQRTSRSDGRTSAHDWNSARDGLGRSSAQYESFHRNRTTDFDKHESSGSRNQSNRVSGNWSNHGNTNPVSVHREFRSSFESKGGQRSPAIQSGGNHSAGHHVNGSGIRGDWNKSNGEKRGRH